MGRYDLHVHTNYSSDGFCTVVDAVEAARAKGLNGIAITDHNCTKGIAEARKISGDIVIIPGAEISSKDGHILGLGIEEEVQRGLPAAETVALIKRQGGIAIAAHPFGLSLKVVALRAKFDAIEVFSPRRYLGNYLARRFAEKNKLPMVAGSDAHFPDEVGLAGATLECGPKVDEILKAIMRGEASIFGRTLPPPIYLRRALHKLIRRRRG